MSYTLGLDYGTNSCRALLVNLDTGQAAAESVFDYPSGESGVLLDPADPHVARQSVKDYIDGLEQIVLGVMREARQLIPGFSADAVVGIGIDTTGSTVFAVDGRCVPLALQSEFAGQLAAESWLWKDHSSHAEAAEITALARDWQTDYITSVGGVYSSEWFWSKALHLLRSAPEVFEKTESLVELCDFLPAILCGVTNPRDIKRGICSAGHKALFDASRGGLPDSDFLGTLAPELAELRPRLFDNAHTSNEIAGTLCDEWSDKLGLQKDIPIAVGAFDAHMGAVGAGIKEGRLVKILGTSTCDIMVSPKNGPAPAISGICGVVDGSVLPGYWGIEAGQSAVGDIFLWYVNRHVPTGYGDTVKERFERLEREALSVRPGASGLVGLDWHNGNRTILVDPLLSGAMLGYSLQSTPGEVYRALIESTAYGALKIIERIEGGGVDVQEVVCCGGLSVRNQLLLRVYADVTGRPMRISAVDQTCAMGAAIFAGAAAGVGTIEELQSRATRLSDVVFEPASEAHKVYREVYELYSDCHDAFGATDGALSHVMKRLITIRNAERGKSKDA